MTGKAEPGAQKSLGNTIQSQHPGINNEIEGAINTLKKLQKITTSAGPGDPSLNNDAGSAEVTNDATVEHSSGVENEDVKFSVDAQGGGKAIPILAAGESFGRYQIARLLGRGAMGAVYLAYDSQLHRYVALKTPFLGDNPQTVQRFYREARASAQLRSPFICPTYDVGQLSGIHFISMAFIDGRSLTQFLADAQRRDSKTIGEITSKIARGLQKAHEQGIIHRDLKPDNIMIDPDGEPIVMDFGLARRLDDEAQITLAGRILGTPAYMSPEQVEGDPKKIGPQTDVYSLGIILYQMLTGRLPFVGSLTSILRQIGNEVPPRPSAIAPEGGVDLRLERICLKMMAKSQTDRYASMADVAAELEGSGPREELQAGNRSLLRSIGTWFIGIFRSRGQGRSVAKADAGSSLKENLAVSDRSRPSKKEDAQSGSQTFQIQDPGQVDIQRGSGTSQGTIPISPNAVQADSQTVDIVATQDNSS
ncbi:MAG: serine/threonine-protein kinase [Gemmataceae bacterium]